MMRKYQAILVLGVSTDERLFAERVNLAVELYNKGVAPLIIFSGRCWGGLANKPRKTEAELMRKLALKMGIPRAATQVEKRSLNTIGNFYFVRKDILEKKRLRSLLVITQKLHAPKSKFLAQKILGPNYTTSWQVTLDTHKNIAKGHSGMREFKKVFPKIHDGDMHAVQQLLKKHPYYRRYRNI